MNLSKKIPMILSTTSLIFSSHTFGVSSRADLISGRSAMIISKKIVEEDDYIRYHFNMGYLLGKIAKHELLGRDGTRDGKTPNVPNYTSFCNNSDCPSGYSIGYWVSKIFTMANTEQDEFLNDPHKSTRTEITTGAGNYDTNRRIKDLVRDWKRITYDGSKPEGSRITTAANSIAVTQSTDPNVSGEAEVQAALTWIKKKNAPEWMATNRFKLLAIANRIDLADKYDSRPTGKATNRPSYYGEVHLIYGVYDPDSEAQNTPYPMTFSLSFKNPLISNVSFNISAANEGEYSLNESTNSNRYDDPGANWATKISRWSQVWSRLSDFTHSSDAYQKRLKAILNTVIKPENFIGIRSNTKISNNEYELRAWYIFKSPHGRNIADGAGNTDEFRGQLIPRKPRNQPYECMEKSNALKNLIVDNWKTDLVPTGDLKVQHNVVFDGTLVDRGATYEHSRAGFSILREKDDRPYLLQENAGNTIDDTFTENNKKAYNTSYLAYNDNGSSNKATFYWKFSGTNNFNCGNTFETMPFYMLTGEGRNRGPWDRPFSNYEDERDRAEKNQLMMLAPFARVKKQSNNKWGRIWDKKNNVTERQRHAFAIRTCNGCHSQEGSAFEGFHVRPRLNNVKSTLSPFLTGDSGNSFTHNSETYVYRELDWRLDFLWEIHPSNSVTPVRYKNLTRRELH